MLRTTPSERIGIRFTDGYEIEVTVVKNFEGNYWVYVSKQCIGYGLSLNQALKMKREFELEYFEGPQTYRYYNPPQANYGEKERLIKDQWRRRLSM